MPPPLPSADREGNPFTVFLLAVMWQEQPNRHHITATGTDARPMAGAAAAAVARLPPGPDRQWPGRRRPDLPGWGRLGRPAVQRAARGVALPEEEHQRPAGDQLPRAADPKPRLQRDGAGGDSEYWQGVAFAALNSISIFHICGLLQHFLRGIPKIATKQCQQPT